METISEDYRAQNAALHQQRSDFGAGSERWAIFVAQLGRQHEAKTILDYGAGKGALKPPLEKHYDVRMYDPAIPEIADAPEPADIVVCTDVMEHIEPDYLDAVLDHIADLSNMVAMITIATRPAVKHLPDGRNAHLIVRPGHWWLAKLSEHFVILRSVDQTGELLVVVKPKIQTEKADAA